MHAPGAVPGARPVHPADEAEEHAALHARRGADHAPRPRVLRLMRSADRRINRRCSAACSSACSRRCRRQRRQLLLLSVGRRRRRAGRVPACSRITRARSTTGDGALVRAARRAHRRGHRDCRCPCQSSRCSAPIQRAALASSSVASSTTCRPKSREMLGRYSGRGVVERAVRSCSASSLRDRRSIFGTLGGAARRWRSSARRRRRRRLPPMPPTSDRRRRWCPEPP